MTAPVIPVVEPIEEATGAGRGAAAGVRPGFVGGVRAWWSSLWAAFAPQRAGRVWLKTSLWQAAAVGAIHLVTGVFWALAVLFSAFLWERGQVHRPMLGHMDQFEWRAAGLREGWAGFLAGLLEPYQNMSLLDKFGSVAGAVVMIGLAWALPFFVLLPFGARPGPNKPCVRHVARTVLLGFGMVHVWGLVLTGVFWYRIAFPGDVTIASYLRILTPVLLAVTGLGLWTWAALVRAVRLDYRTPADLPEAHDPWCDECGYNLIAAELNGRCPECGRPVLESIGSHKRLPTAWEARPGVGNVGAIIGQLKQLVARPRSLFFSMPTLTGQRAAQRWLVMSLVVIGAAGLPIVPAMALAREAEWSFELVSGALVMGLVWAVLSCMMVGIETAGIATFSRMKGHGVYLGTAAKVTCYSSILMVVWVVLGGLQLVAFTTYFTELFLAPMRFGSVRIHQILIAGALALPHIAGLMWYELTVYRGIRGVQYANK